MSAQPSLDACETEPKQIRLAMAVSDRQRTRTDDIHHASFSRRRPSGFAERLGRYVLADLKARREGAIARDLTGFPADFLAAVSVGMESGFRRRLTALAGPV